MTSELLLYTIADGVATLTLNRPEQRNALSLELLEDLKRALSTANGDDAVRVVVLTGAGDKAFCAGADLRQLAEGHADAATVAVADIFQLCNNLDKPLIGAINGHALAGGFGLALSCHLLVASEKAAFGAPEIKIGLWPMMISAIVTRNLPRKRAMELFLRGNRIEATTAQEWGLVNAVVGPEDVLPEAQRWAGEIAAGSPAAIGRGLQAMRRAEDQDFSHAVEGLRQEFSQLTATAEFKDAVREFLDR